MYWTSQRALEEKKIKVTSTTIKKVDRNIHLTKTEGNYHSSINSCSFVLRKINGQEG